MYYENIILALVEKYKHVHDQETVTANRLDAKVLESVARKPSASPHSHADYLKINYERVLQILRYFGLNNQEYRDLANEQLQVFLDLLRQRIEEQQTREMGKAWKEENKKIMDVLHKERAQLARGFYLMALFRFCSDRNYRALFPVRQVWLYDLSAIDARNFFLDLDYKINQQEKFFDLENLNDVINDSVAETDVQEDEEETLEDRLQSVEFQLQTTRSTLKFVQHSFDDMVANIQTRSEVAKEEAVNEFFIQLNSERYGRLLDNAFLVEKKMEQLRKEKYRFPMQVMTLPILLHNFTNFIKASGFQPIDTVGRVFEAGADDLLYVVYEGEPFLDEETKKVQVVSPGWKKGHAVISKTVVKEVIE